MSESIDRDTHDHDMTYENEQSMFTIPLKENEYIMERMHPAVMIPGFFIGFMVLIGCLFKGYMGW